MKGKTAIVTGSTSGIGHGIATALRANGCNILLYRLRTDVEMEQIRADLAKSYGVKVGYSPADMSKPIDIRAMVALAASELGGADILVNNAGIQFTAPVEEFPDDKWDAIIAINMSSAFHASKAAIPLMRKAGWGRIINIASAHGLVASPHKAAYVTAKHGLVGLTKVVALENANAGITCNAICPGWVLTPLVQKQIDDRAKQNGTSVEQEKLALLGEKQPMNQFTTPAQLGALAVFLCSNNGATMTATTLSMDGGWVAQ